MALLGFLLCASLSQAAGLNDTGITDCSNDSVVDNTSGVEADTGTHPRQDCRYGRDPAAALGMPKVGGGDKGFDFTKIANNGTVLPESAVLGSGPTDWACTRDNVTGLVWEVKTTIGLRGQDHTYTWYSSDATINGGFAGMPAGGTCQTAGRCDTEKFVADVNAIGLCGAGIWRIPMLTELQSIVDFGRGWPAIDLIYFPNTYAKTKNGNWTASTSADNASNAWVVDFVGGVAVGEAKGNQYLIRLVRGG
jgi:hypothetical protein